jgi:hypothetical protein
MAAKIPQGVRERQLRELAEADGYTFVGWIGEYQNSFSKVMFKCSSHGKWPVSIHGFVTKKSRCPACGGT